MKLSNDVCRCCGKGCERRNTCLRYTDVPLGPNRTPYNSRLCYFTEEEEFMSYYIKDIDYAG